MTVKNAGMAVKKIAAAIPHLFAPLRPCVKFQDGG